MYCCMATNRKIRVLTGTYSVQIFLGMFIFSKTYRQIGLKSKISPSAAPLVGLETKFPLLKVP